MDSMQVSRRRSVTGERRAMIVVLVLVKSGSNLGQVMPIREPEKHLEYGALSALRLRFRAFHPCLTPPDC